MEYKSPYAEKPKPKQKAKVAKVKPKKPHSSHKKRKRNASTHKQKPKFTQKNCEFCNNYFRTHHGFTLKEICKRLQKIMSGMSCTDKNCPYMQLPSNIPHLCSRRFIHNKSMVVPSDYICYHRPYPDIHRNKGKEPIPRCKKKKPLKRDGAEFYFTKYQTNVDFKPPKDLDKAFHKFGAITCIQLMEYREALSYVYKQHMNERTYCKMLDAIKIWEKNLSDLRPKNIDKFREAYAIYNNIDPKYLASSWKDLLCPSEEIVT